jgi:GT2 family glycosyltransferase
VSVKVAVVIVNWNGGDCLTQCLRSVAEQERPPERVIVVDNASSDGSFDHALRQFPFVEPIRLGTNVGFAVANNVALRACGDCDWVALLNPDAYPAPSWLSALLAAAQLNPEHVAFASQLRSAAQDDRLDGTGDVYHVSGSTWRARHGGPLPSPESPCEVFSACAAAALYRRSALMEIGGFDEKYFCYHEDIDAGFRMRLRGYRCLYIPDAVVRHVGSASSGKRSDFSTYHGHRNLVWTFIKNMPAPLLAVYLPQHVIFNVVSLLWFSARGQSRTILRAKLDALRGLPWVLRERRYVQRHRRVGARALRSAMARGWLMPYTGRAGAAGIAAGNTAA